MFCNFDADADVNANADAEMPIARFLNGQGDHINCICFN